jgi:hypothetical protein
VSVDESTWRRAVVTLIARSGARALAEQQAGEMQTREAASTSSLDLPT